MTTYSINKTTITIFIDNNLTTVHSTSPNFEDLKTALRSLAPESKIRELLSNEKWIKKAFQGKVNVFVNPDTGEIAVEYNGKRIKGMIAKKIFDLIQEGFNVNPWVNLMKNIEANPDVVKSRIFDFLETNKFPITPEGEFIAFKNVREDYFDIKTGTMRNFPGDVLMMPREKVNPDPNQTCSTGLHCCASHYLPNYSVGGRTVIVRVNPKDVVSVPVDYNDSKMRVCKYVVIGEVNGDSAIKRVEDTVVHEEKKEMTFGSEMKKSSSGFSAPANAIDKIKEMGLSAYAESVGAKVHLLKNWLLENAPSLLSEVITFNGKDGKVFTGKEVKDGVEKKGTIAAWAKDNGLNPSTVGDWLRRIRETASGATKKD